MSPQTVPPTQLASPTSLRAQSGWVGLHAADGPSVAGSPVKTSLPRPGWDPVAEKLLVPKGQEGAWAGSSLCQGYLCDLGQVTALVWASGSFSWV